MANSKAGHEPKRPSEAKRGAWIGLDGATKDKLAK